MDGIEDRLRSFGGRLSRHGGVIDVRFDFADMRLQHDASLLRVSAEAGDSEALARARDLLATAVHVHARAGAPRMHWTGDLANETRPASFREMTVCQVQSITGNMRRIRLTGENLEAFSRFGGMHIRMLLPTREVPAPDWPTLGDDGLMQWPAPERRPVPRAYTIRQLDAAGGWMDVDFVVHEGNSVGASWACRARPGDRIGILGPVGRPVPDNAGWYLMGADETGLPAVARLLETLPEHTRGMAFLEVASHEERPLIANRTGIVVSWIDRNGIPAGRDERLAAAVMAVQWPQDVSCFGWFAAEAKAAGLIRNHWREVMKLGRDRTLAATYWKEGHEGFMAGGARSG